VVGTNQSQSRVRATTTPRSRGTQCGPRFAAYEKAGATATLALVHAAGHNGEYLDAEEERTVLQTSGGVTTRGSAPAPTYDTLLSFLRDTLGA
jgi:hypothetical protein